MKLLLAIVGLVAIHTAALADRYGIREAMEDSGPFPPWGWTVLFFLAIGYAVYQHREHREVERSTHNLANSAIQEARKNERRLSEAVAKLERERAAAWEELALLRNELYEHRAELPDTGKLRSAIDRHFEKYPHVLSRSE